MGGEVFRLGKTAQRVAPVTLARASTPSTSPPANPSETAIDFGK